MASGKVHDQWIQFISVGGMFIAANQAIGGLLASRSIPVEAFQTGTLSFGCLLGGLMLSPDLDLPTSNVQRRWGNIGLKILWWPYENAFKHRSFWSHGFIYNKRGDIVFYVPVVAPLLRSAYILFWITAFCLTWDYFTEGPFDLMNGRLQPNGLSVFVLNTLERNIEWAAWFFGGICIADLIHAFLDVFVKNREQSYSEIDGIRRGD